jgi:signal transduction histidine kinase
LKEKVTKSIILIYLAVLNVLSLNAQSGIAKEFTDVSAIKDSLFLKECLLLVDSNHHILPSKALDNNWEPLSGFKINTYAPASWVTKTIYLQLNLVNSDTANTTVFFYPGISYKSITTYKLQRNNTLLPINDLSRLDGFQPINIAAKEQLTLLVALQFTKRPFNQLLPQIITAHYLSKYQKILYYKNDTQLIVGYLLSGILFMMFFFSMANFILNKKSDFLLNGCYTACMFLLFFFSTFFENKAGVPTSLFYGFFSFVLLSAGIVFYIAFTRKFLDTAKNFPKLNTILLIEQVAFVTALICFTYLHFFTDNFYLQGLLENIMKITALLIGVVYIVTAFIQKSRLFYYLAAGNSMLILFAIISFYFLLKRVDSVSVFSSPIFYYELGIVSEIMFFILGLTYKNRKELIEKIQEQGYMKHLVERQLYETKLAVLNAQQQERNRISADMHDDLGAGITAIRLYSEFAKSKLKIEAVAEIEKISATANELLNNMNAIIWTMSSNNESLEDMVAYIRNYIQEVLENTSIKSTINIVEDLPDVKVSSQLRRNVFLVIKESLNNILKHSSANTVTFTLTKVPDGLSLFIQDDGIGFDLENVRRFGNGLKNMKRRMDEMSIDFSIENNNGTLIILHYALPVV